MGTRGSTGALGACSACNFRVRHAPGSRTPGGLPEDASARDLAAAEKAAARAQLAAVKAAQAVEFAQGDLAAEERGARERRDRLLEELQAAVARDLAGRGVVLEHAELDLPGRAIRLRSELSFAPSGDNFTDRDAADAVLNEVATLLAVANQELADRGSPELQLLVQAAGGGEGGQAVGVARASAARAHLIAAALKLGKAASKPRLERQLVARVADEPAPAGGGSAAIALVVIAPGEALPGEANVDEPRQVTAARRRVETAMRDAKLGKDAAVRAAATVGPMAEVAAAQAGAAHSAVDCKLNEAGDALAALETVDGAAAVAADLRALLGAVRLERERAVAARREAETLSASLTDETNRAAEVSASAAADVAAAERAKAAADKARWAADDARVAARREAKAAQRATRESELAAEAARREAEAAHRVVFAARRAREEQRVAESGAAHAQSEAVRAREARASAEEAMHQAVERRERMEAGMQGMKDELAARAREQRSKLEQDTKGTLAEKSAAQADVRRLKAKAAGELEALQREAAQAEAARDEAIAQKAELDAKISLLQQQVEELQEANTAAEAARKARLAKMVEEVQAAVKRDLRSRDVYLTAIDMDLPRGAITLKENVAFRPGEAVFASVAKEETPGAEGDDAEGSEAAGEAEEGGVVVTALDQMAAALAAAMRELAKRNEAPLALVVEGHTDAEDSPLSQQRANACKDYLVAKVSVLEPSLKAGDVAGAITAKGFGSSVVAKQAITLKVDMHAG
eukprot:jgi/Tetstr1/457308/TSEL_043913.t1